jgi:hypothetical protein
MRILVTGARRTGTTWVGSVLGATAGAGYLHEPDSVTDGRWRPFATKALRGLGNSPTIEPRAGAPRAYEELWDAAFSDRVRQVPGQARVARALYRRLSAEQLRAAMGATGARASVTARVVGALAVPAHFEAPGPARRVVKSVQLPFALDWVAARVQAQVVVCCRHPLDVVASARGLNWGSPVGRISPALRAQSLAWGVDLPAPDDPVVGIAWTVGMQMSALDASAGAHPEYHVVDHATLCEDPAREFRKLVDVLGLEWTQSVDEFLRTSDRPGRGYELTRVAAEQRERWRERLSADEASAAIGVLAQFPIAERYEVG